MHLIWSDGKGRQASCLQVQREGGLQGNWTCNSDLGFPLSPCTQISGISLIPRLALFLVMTWLEPSQDMCSHRAPEEREGVTLHILSRVLVSLTSCSCRTALNQLLENCENVLTGSRLELRKVSFLPSNWATWVDTQEYLGPVSGAREKKEWRGFSSQQCPGLKVVLS